jgi:signal transduction histidine kinase
VFFSLTRAPEPLERLQASIFVPSDLGPAPALRFGRTAVTVGDLQATVARYLGDERAERAFARHASDRGVALSPHLAADPALLRFSEQLLASAVGAASSRLVLSLLVKRRDPATKSAHRLLDDATAAIQHNRDLLQTALDQVDEGIAVFDPELRLSCWNRRFRSLLALPADFGLVGTPLRTILTHVAEGGGLGPGDPDRLVAERLSRLLSADGEIQERIDGRVVEARPSPMPDGGLVLTVADMTGRVRAAEALEQRVRERTDELLRLNEELIRAKAAAEDANFGKTRFLAAAGHDILQPLNAARLYVTTLVDRTGDGPLRPMVENVGASLESVEEIIGAVLDISRLDGGAMKAEPSVFALDELLQGLAVEFAPIARERGLELTVLRCSLAVRSDRRLLRRLLQNLISNAVKYTPSGRVLVGCRRRRGAVSIEVVDTGIGIPLSKQRAIFTEFLRLEPGMKAAKGLGLGLSIVERIARVLDHKLALASTPGRGTRFSILVPRAAPLPAMATTAAARSTPSSSQLAGLKLLAIDNEPAILDGMRLLLGGWGCKVETAADLDEASSIIAAGGAPDVLIADYHLDHGENGIALISALRQQVGGLPAILLTADRSPEVREEAGALDIHVLNKPLKPGALRALLAQWRATRLAAE